MTFYGRAACRVPGVPNAAPVAAEHVRVIYNTGEVTVGTDGLLGFFSATIPNEGQLSRLVDLDVHCGGQFVTDHWVNPNRYEWVSNNWLWYDTWVGDIIVD